MSCSIYIICLIICEKPHKERVESSICIYSFIEISKVFFFPFPSIYYFKEVEI